MEAHVVSAWQSTFDYIDKNKKVANNIKSLDKWESIAGMNCWDLTWSLGTWLKSKENKYIKNIEKVECMVLGNGSHYVTALQILDPTRYDRYDPIKKYTIDILIDLTYSNQHQFKEPIIPNRYWNTETLKGEKAYQFMKIEDIPKKINEIEIESPEDLYDEFDEIFKDWVN